MFSDHIRAIIGSFGGACVCMKKFEAIFNYFPLKEHEEAKFGAKYDKNFIQLFFRGPPTLTVLNCLAV